MAENAGKFRCYRDYKNAHKGKKIPMQGGF